MSPKKLDISALTDALGTLAVREEKPEELTVRLEQEKLEANHRRWKDKWVFGIGGGLAVLLFLLSLGFALGSTGDTQKWAQSIVTLFAGGLVGYLVGAAGKKPEGKG